MKVERQDVDGVTIVRLNGNLNTQSALEVKRVFSELMAEERYEVVVDLEKVAQINYAGVGILLERLRRLRQNNGNLKLARVGRYLQAVFRMVGAARIFETFDSDSAAVASFRPGTPNPVATAGGRP